MGLEKYRLGVGRGVGAVRMLGGIEWIRDDVLVDRIALEQRHVESR